MTVLAREGAIVQTCVDAMNQLTSSQSLIRARTKLGGDK